MARLAVYRRVSTTAQDTASQDHAIKLWLGERTGDTVQVFEDLGMSGKTSDRPGLQALAAAVSAGEVDGVVVYRLDRLSRHAVTALKLLLDWAGRGVEFWAVDQPVLNAVKGDPFRLTKLAMFSELAQVERETTVARVNAGLAAAKARGVRLGALPKLTPDQQNEARVLRAGGATLKALATRYGVGLATIHKICKELTCNSK